MALLYGRAFIDQIGELRVDGRSVLLQEYTHDKSLGLYEFIKAGLVPNNCTDISVHIPLDGCVMMTYTVYANQDLFEFNLADKLASKVYDTNL
jgi:hypothetical protein